MRTGRSLLAVLLATTLLASFPASAGPGTAAAQTLFDQGRLALEAKDYGTACARFRESDRLDPAVGTKLNLANCEELRGELAVAWELFRDVAAALPDSDDRKPLATDRAQKLDARLPKLVVLLAPGAPPGTVVTADALELGAASLGTPLPMDVGTHVLVVTAPGREPVRTTLELAEGQRLSFEATPGPASSAALPPTIAQAELDAPPESGARSHWLGYTLGGVGVGGLLLGGVTGLMALGKKSTADEHCLPDGCDDTGKGQDAIDSGKTLGMVSTIGFIAGGLALGAGLYFVLGDGGGASEPETVLQAGVSEGGGSLTLLQRW